MVLVQVYIFVVRIGPTFDMEEVADGRGTEIFTNPYKQKYTIIVPTFRRLDLIKPFVEHHMRCPSVDAIRIVWNDVDSTPPADPNKFFDIDPKFKHVQVKFDTFSQNNLNNRCWKPPDATPS